MHHKHSDLIFIHMHKIKIHKHELKKLMRNIQDKHKAVISFNWYSTLITQADKLKKNFETLEQ